MLPNIGIPELLIILVIVLLMFGAKKLPEIGRSLGGGIREFKKSITAMNEEEEKPSNNKVDSASNVEEANKES
jgi:sec-independent protein translocase protein TatA